MKKLLSFLFLALLRGASLHAQAGALDPSLAGSGVFFPNAGPTSWALAVQPDGKILFSGNFTSQGVEIRRYLPNGSLDNAFSGDGRAPINPVSTPNPIIIIRDLALTASGDMVLCGRVNDRLMLIKLKPDGTFDNSFGVNGVVLKQEVLTIEPFSVAIQNDGKIVAMADWGGNTYLYRFGPNGQDDLGFASSGRLKVPLLLTHGMRLLVQPDGKILVAGQRQFPASFDGVALMLRFLPNGVLDNSFGLGGLLEMDYTGKLDWFNDIALTTEGKILSVSKLLINGALTYSVVRFTSAGVPDTDFGVNGAAYLSCSSCVLRTLALQADGKIVVAGSVDLSPGNSSLICARFHPDGSVDTDFGNSGQVSTDVGNSEYSSRLFVQHDGKILTGGSNNTSAVITRHFAGDPVDVQDVSVYQEGFQVYPNPLHGNEFVLQHHLSAPLRLRADLLDLRGVCIACLWEGEAAAGVISLRLPSGLAAGLYLVNVQAEQGGGIFRIVVGSQE